MPTTVKRTRLAATRPTGPRLGLVAKVLAVASSSAGGRKQLYQKQALADAAKGQPLNTTALAAIEAMHAYNWTTATNKYPVETVGDALAVSVAMQGKYKSYFSSC